MACWQDLYAMLLDEELTAEQVVARVGVKPSRLRRLLESKRMAARLAVVAEVAEARGEQALAAGQERAARKLAALAGQGEGETSRKACLDVMDKAQAIRSRRGLAEPVPGYNRWARDYRRRERSRRRAGAAMPANSGGMPPDQPAMSRGDMPAGDEVGASPLRPAAGVAAAPLVVVPAGRFPPRNLRGRSKGKGPASPTAHPKPRRGKGKS